jgi:hypothetical protein
MTDSESLESLQHVSPLTIQKPNIKISKKIDDFPTMCADIINCINFKMCGFLFFIGIFIFSDIFMENILEKLKNGLEAGVPTTKGTLVQISTLVLAYVVVDLLIQSSLL